MEPDTEEIVDRLKAARSLPWLRAIDAAELDGPVEAEPDAETVVTPYRWLLTRIGEGVTLTQAGYLRPAVVTEAMTELGWADDWIGKGNREDMTYPVLELRESAQRFGLLRKYRGRLVPTKVGRSLADDPHGLWWHLATSLPDARSGPQRHGGVLYLLTVAAGLPMSNALVAEGMTILGWSQGDTHQRLSPGAAFETTRDTWAMFQRLGLVSRSFSRRDDAPSDAARRLARASLVGRSVSAGPRAPVVPARRSDASVAQLRVVLRDTEPEIWRRLLVPASLTLLQLHAVLQTAMGWEDYHLHMFDVDGVLYGDVEEMEGHPLGDERMFTLAQAADAVREFSYQYDFGDSWDHDIVIEQVVPSVGIAVPQLIEGARACPPEDCGGVGGYEELLEVLADPSNAEHREMLQWVGGSYDPDALDVDELNSALELYDRLTRRQHL